MSDQFRESTIEIYKAYGVEYLKTRLQDCRESFRQSQSEQDAVRCEVLSELIESKSKQ